MTPTNSPSPPPLPFDRSYWVSPGKLVAGFYPGDFTTWAIEEKVGALIDCGIRSIVNLMQEGDINWDGLDVVPYEDYFQSRCAELKIDACWKRFPIVDMSLTDETHMISILDHIDAEIEKGRIVYVHCLAGLGRTGMVVGCWLVRHDLTTTDDFIDKIKELRVNDAANIASSPQTVEQVMLVKKWKKWK